MKISVDRATLAEEMRHVLRVVGSGTVIAMLPYVRLDIHEGALRFFATDLETSIITSCAVEIERTGGCCIEAKLLSRFVSDAPADVISIDVDGGYATLTAGASSSLKAPVRHVDEFPAMPELEDVEASAELPASLFARLLGAVMYACDPTEPRDFCKGPITIIGKHRIACRGTNGYRLAMAEATALVTGDVTQVIRYATAKAWLAQDIRDDDATIHVARNHVFIAGDKRTFIGRRIDTNMPDMEPYKEVGDDTYTVDRVALLRAISRTADAIGDKHRFALLEFGADSVKLSAKSDRADASETVALESNGGVFANRYEISYLRDACAAYDSDVITVALVSVGPELFRLSTKQLPLVDGIEESHSVMPNIL